MITGLSMPDRRRVSDRRIPISRRSAEDRAAQVEKIYDAVPMHKRAEIGLNYAHVRAVLGALQ